MIVHEPTNASYPNRASLSTTGFVTRFLIAPAWKMTRQNPSRGQAREGARERRRTYRSARPPGDGVPPWLSWLATIVATAANCYIAYLIFSTFGASIILNVTFLLPVLIYRVGSWDQAGVSGAATLAAISRLMLEAGQAPEFALLLASLVVCAAIFARLDERGRHFADPDRPPILPQTLPEAMSRARLSVVVLDGARRWKYVNQAALDALGIRSNEADVTGRDNQSVLEMMPPKSRNAWRDLIDTQRDHAIETEGVDRKEIRIVCQVEKLPDGGILISGFTSDLWRLQPKAIAPARAMDSGAFPAIAFTSDGFVAWMNDSGRAALTGFDTESVSAGEIFDGADDFYSSVWRPARGASTAAIALPHLTLKPSVLENLLGIFPPGDVPETSLFMISGLAVDNESGKHATLFLTPTPIHHGPLA